MNRLKNNSLRMLLCLILLSAGCLTAEAQLSENVQMSDQNKMPDSKIDNIKNDRHRIGKFSTARNFVKLIVNPPESRLRDLPQNITIEFFKAGIFAGRLLNNLEIKEHLQAGFRLMIQMMERQVDKR